VGRERDQIAAVPGYPCSVVSDNGTTLTRNAILTWQEHRGVQCPCIAPGKPMQDGFAASFNGPRPDHLLNERLLDTRRHARNPEAAWRDDSNHHRPHASLAGLTPREYANRSRQGQNPKRANS
jgi:putative transposase